MGPLPRTLSIDTYKHHFLGDYPKAIRQIGTIDFNFYGTREPLQLIMSLDALNISFQGEFGASYT